MFRHVQLTRYISILIVLRYDTSRSSNFSLFLQEQNWSFFNLSDQTTIKELNRCVFIHMKML